MRTPPLLFLSRGRLLAVLVGIFAWGLCAQADPGADSATSMRLLKTHCFSCHNAEKKKGGLMMITREALIEGGENGPAIVEGAPEKSALIEALSADADPHMPPKKQLAAGQIALLSRWVKDGAPWDAIALKDSAPAPRVVALSTLPRSYHPVLALALSPDSTRLAVGCGNQVLLYDVASKEITKLEHASLHPDPVQSIAWSPDGRRLASGAFRQVVIWDAESLTAEHQITAGLTDRISALRFLADGNQLAVADGRVSENGTVRIVDVACGGITGSWPAHADLIYDMAISSDGAMLATAGGDKLVKIWDLATYSEIARFEGHVAQVLTLAFDASSAQLVTGGADQQLKVWDVKTRERLITLGTHTAAINGVMWTPTSVFAVTDGGGLVRYTDFKAHSGAQSSESAQEKNFEGAGNALYCVVASPGGDRVFAGSYDGRLFVWNKDGKLTAKLDLFEDKPAQ
ncbi:MAG: hypothetical protein JWL59_2213 [Chthoniobacteraceae bacterium]|nr:hypothetical protein [Chthoniobacteraceae bacterium]